MSVTFPPVQEILPHRDPFLFVDRIIEMDEKHVVGIREFRADDPFFKGHFPGEPIVPGVILMEGLAQTMAYFALYHRKASRIFLVGIDRARFRSAVAPGETVRYEVTPDPMERLGTLRGAGLVYSGDRLVADGKLMGYAGEGKIL